MMTLASEPTTETASAVLKQLFEGPYYFVGVLLFAGVLVAMFTIGWQIRSERRARARSDSLQAIALAEWLQLGEGNDARTAAFRLIDESEHSGTLLAIFPDDPGPVGRLSFGDMGTSLDARLGSDKPDDALRALEEVRTGDSAAVRMLRMLDIFAAKVLRGPCDAATAYDYCAPDFCSAVGQWAPLIAYFRQEQDRRFFDDGISLYELWTEAMRQDGRLPEPGGNADVA